MQFLRLATVFVWLIIPNTPLAAQTLVDTVQTYDGQNRFKDRSKWATVPKEVLEWYEKQRMNYGVQERLGLPYSSCCDNGDVFHTRFRLIDDGSKYGVEGYEYLREGQWHVIPPDVVQHKPTPDGRPRLFLRGNTARDPICFIIDKEGI